MLRRRHWFAGLMLLLGGVNAAYAETLSRTLVFEGKERSFLLTAPRPSSGEARALVIALHPYPGIGRIMADLTGFSELAEKEGFLIAYPDGINEGFNAMICCGNENDVGFVKAVVDKVSTDYPVDPKRVYATGISNGADLTYRLAVELPGVFAAIGPVSGGMTGDWMQKKTGNLPSKPVSLITLYGGKDRYQAVFGIGAKFWLQRQDCTSETSMINDAIELTQGACPNGTSTAMYRLPDMGHAWPGSKGTKEGMLAYPKSPLQATALIWQFFREHPAK